jgi:hypothetical protein
MSKSHWEQQANPSQKTGISNCPVPMILFPAQFQYMRNQNPVKQNPDIFAKIKPK